MHQRRQAETGAVWAVARPGGAALGLVGWNDVDLAGGSAEIVYWVLPEARGGGLVVDAVRRLCRWALDELGLHRLRLCHSVAWFPAPLGGGVSAVPGPSSAQQYRQGQ